MGEPEQENNQPEVVIIRDGRSSLGRTPRYVWLLLVAIVAFFAAGMLMWASGLLRPDPEDIPQPPAYALTATAEAGE